MAVAAARAFKTPAWMSEMMDLEEETGMTCMVCHEGYKCKVRHVLGAEGWGGGVRASHEECRVLMRRMLSSHVVVVCMFAGVCLRV